MSGIKIEQWVVLDLDVFRKEHLYAKYRWQTNMDGTAFHAYEILSFPPNLIVGCSANLEILLDPDLAIPYCELDPAAKKKRIDLLIHGKKTSTMSPDLSRDHALREWHTNPSIKEDFETYYANRLAARKAAE